MMWLAASVFVIVLWGISTAVIFYLDSLSPKTFRTSMAAATLLLAISAYVVWFYRADASTLALYASFAAGLLAWGWTEMALYMGYITGPRKVRCEDGCHGAAHFGHAVLANLWHELVVIVFAALIWWTGNTVAAHCFIMLWLMHLSARLNVFLGVRNVSAEFVPDHMDVLKGFLRRRRMNALFPFSCLALVALIFWLSQLPQSVSTVMAITLAVIGLVEHVLLMLPLPVEKLWSWALARDAAPQSQSDHQNTRDNTKHRKELRVLGVPS
jgi:putative photosynthetic complex assembly protein 2